MTDTKPSDVDGLIAELREFGTRAANNIRDLCLKSCGEPCQCSREAEAAEEWADRAATTLAAQLARVEALERALAFYARENSWKSCGMYMSGRPNPSSAEIDAGNKARAALKEPS